LVTQPEDTPGLGLGGNLERHMAIERRHVDAATEHGGGEADRDLARQMLAVALENLVRLHVHFDVEIARRSAVAPGLALARQANAIAGVHARRNLHGESLGSAHSTLPQAGVAGILDDGAAATTLGTRLLQLEETLRDAHLA